jgi:hypothetical protein
MAENIQTQNTDEIDLSVFFKKIESFFKSILLGIIMFFRFLWKHKIRLLILLLIGIFLKLFITTQISRIYVSELLVRSNFGSTEYLYGKIKSINSKIDKEDTLYLKNVFGKNHHRVKELEVVPVIDVYHMMDNTDGKQELFKLLFEEFGDIAFLEEDINVNEYPNHKVRVFINGAEENKNIADALLIFLLDNSFYNDLKLNHLESYGEQLKENKIMRSQIDSIIEHRNNKTPKPGNNAVNFEISQDLSLLLKQKQNILLNNLELKTALTSENEVIKVIASSYGLLSEKRNLIYTILPFILAAVYCLVYFSNYLVKRILRFVN